MTDSYRRSACIIEKKNHWLLPLLFKIPGCTTTITEFSPFALAFHPFAALSISNPVAHIVQPDLLHTLSRAPSALTHTGPGEQPADQSFRIRPLGFIGLLPYHPLPAGQCGYQEAQVPAVCHPAATQAQAPGLPQSETKGGWYVCKTQLQDGRAFATRCYTSEARCVNQLLPKLSPLDFCTVKQNVRCVDGGTSV